MRRLLIAGAQKLYLSIDQSIEYARKLVGATNNKHFPFDIAICPSFINLAHVVDIVGGSQIEVGAQNFHQETSGAFTGQVSLQELKAVGAKYSILGHSELRTQQGETNGLINAKIMTCLKHEVIPIVCVGETREDKKAGRAQKVIEEDVKAILREFLNK